MTPVQSEPEVAFSAPGTGSERGKAYWISAVPIVGFMLLFPFYLWESGLPQLSDFVAVVAMIASIPLIVRNLPRSPQSLFRLVALFCIYATIVQLFWFFALGGSAHRIKILFFPLFYAFDALKFTLLVKFFVVYGKRAVHLVVNAIIVSAIGQGLFAVSGVLGGHYREALFFNNPNQLGYYALLSASIISVRYKLLGGRFFVNLAALTACLYCAALSLSKSAMLGVALLLVLLALSNPKRGLPIILLLAGLAFAGSRGSSLSERLQARLSAIGKDNDDSVEARGYDRIWLYPENMILGAGEGTAHERFPSLKFHGEIHSSFATVLFSYGIPGSLLFFTFLFLCLRVSGPAASVYALPAVLYGLTHMGLRFTHFWVLLALLVSIPLVARRLSPSAKGTWFRLIRVQAPPASAP